MRRVRQVRTATAPVKQSYKAADSDEPFHRVYRFFSFRNEALPHDGSEGVPPMISMSSGASLSIALGSAPTKRFLRQNSRYRRLSTSNES